MAAELGRLVVRENRSNPTSNLIELAFVRLKSTAEKPGYSTVYLDGGPGSSAINIARIPDYMRAFMKLREAGDVILLDQRGVGRSKPNLSRLSSESLQVTDQPTKKPVDLKIGKIGLQFLIMRDLGDTNDLPIFPVWFYTMHQGDYSILSRFAERRYNQFGGGSR